LNILRAFLHKLTQTTQIPELSQLNVKLGFEKEKVCSKRCTLYRVVSRQPNIQHTRCMAQSAFGPGTACYMDMGMASARRASCTEETDMNDAHAQPWAMGSSNTRGGGGQIVHFAEAGQRPRGTWWYTGELQEVSERLQHRAEGYTGGANSRAQNGTRGIPREAWREAGPPRRVG